MGSHYTHIPPHPEAAYYKSSQKLGKITHKWSLFTYFGRQTTFISNIFKKTDIRITLCTKNTLQKLLMPKPQTLYKYSRSGTYKLMCPDCNKAYVGQMGRSFTQRFKEHRNAFKSSRNTSNYIKHSLEHSHPFGPIHETMQILQYQGKRAHLFTTERYFIYKEFSINNHLNDKSNIASNKIFDALLKLQ
jgi:hypothetical protein